MPERLLNSDGQPYSGFHHQRLIGRSADELIGICKGVLADGVLDKSEATFLLKWMETNASYVNEWPFNHIYARFAAALEDGVMSNSEERELLGLLGDFTSGSLVDSRQNASTELACDKPVPEIVFANRRFCLTGKFAVGPRKKLAEEIESRGAKVVDSVSRSLDYLLVGAIGSRDWLYSTHGTKLRDAAEHKSEGVPIYVIAERNVIEILRIAVG